MLKFSIKKEALLTPILMVAGAVDKKPATTILSHFLLKLLDNCLLITATDLEIEISAQIACNFLKTNNVNDSITVPAKKFIEIMRSLDDNVAPDFIYENNVLTIKQGRSSFKLITLPADNFPLCKEQPNKVEINLPRLTLLELLQSTYFTMPQQDVRFFLNGLLLEFNLNFISTVGTDGHRMAICRYPNANTDYNKFLLPKKGVQELIRLLSSISDDQVMLTADPTHIKIFTQQYVFLSKLIESRFPAYNKIIPTNNDKHIIIDCTMLKRALSRIVILAHEKHKAVFLHMQSGQLTLIANNEQEEAVESLLVKTHGDELEIKINADYLLDVLNYLGEGEIRLSMSNSDSSILIEPVLNNCYQYIIMPMKI